MGYVFLPPYSPDFQPVEQMFHQLKQWIRTNYREGRVAMSCRDGLSHLFLFLFEGLDSITPDDAFGYFNDCGYFLPRADV